MLGGVDRARSGDLVAPGEREEIDGRVVCQALEAAAGRVDPVDLERAACSDLARSGAAGLRGTRYRVAVADATAPGVDARAEEHQRAVRRERWRAGELVEALALLGR